MKAEHRQLTVPVKRTCWLMVLFHECRDDGRVNHTEILVEARAGW